MGPVKIFPGTFIFGLFMGTSLYAGTHQKQAAGTQEQLSSKAQSDRFRLSAAFGKKFHKTVQGKAMDMDERQPIHILTSKDLKWLKDAVGTQINLKEGEVALANFHCWGQDWTIKIPKNFVDKVYAQQEYFETRPHWSVDWLMMLGEEFGWNGHAQLRAVADVGKEFEIYPQKVGQKKPPVSKLANIIFSGEAVRAPGSSFNPIDGNRKKYGMTLRAVCDEDKYKGMWEQLKHHTPQFPLHPNMNAHKSEHQMLQEVVKTSMQRGDQYYKAFEKKDPELYNTRGVGGHSCITVQKEVIDTVNKSQYNKLQQRVLDQTLLDFLPRRIRPGYAFRGMLGWQGVVTGMAAPDFFPGAVSYEEEHRQWAEFVKQHPELHLNPYDSRWEQRDKLLADYQRQQVASRSVSSTQSTR